MTILYGMTHWAARYCKAIDRKIDYICDRKAIVIDGIPALQLNGIPVINIDTLKRIMGEQNGSVQIYICVGVNKKTVDEIRYDLQILGSRIVVKDLFDVEESSFLPQICRMRINENSVSENYNSQSSCDYVVISNLEVFAKYQGIFSYIQAIMGYIYEIRTAGYIPLIDFRKGETTLESFWSFQSLQTGKNSWLSYFTQPDTISDIDEIEKRQNILYINKPYNTLVYFDLYRLLPCSARERKFWGNIIKQNIHLLPSIEDEVEENYNTMLLNRRVLGVAIRSEFRYGGEQHISLYNNHPIVGKCNEYIEQVEKRMMDYKCDYIFLLVDDREYHDLIKKHFQGRFLSLNRPLAHFFHDGEPISNELPLIQDNSEVFIELRSISSENKTKDYLIETYLLSKCTSLYCTPGSAQSFAYFLNDGKYEHVEIDDRGRYVI